MWRSAQPDSEEDFDFRDRFVRLGLTFGGAGVIRGDLTPECAAAVTAVMEALGKKRGPEDDRNEGQRFHDALAEACHLLIRSRLVPDRAGADTQVIVHIPISQLRQMPGAADLEDAWLRARLGETSVHNCGLFCEFHHETCIHRWGWQIILHPDGTMEARSPDGGQILRNHAPPNQRAA